MFDANIDYATLTSAQDRWDQAVENAQYCVQEAITLVEDAERDEVEPDEDEMRYLTTHYARAITCLSDIAALLGDAVDDKPLSWWDSADGESAYDVIEFDYTIDPDFTDIDELCDLEYRLDDIVRYEFPDYVTIKFD